MYLGIQVLSREVLASMPKRGSIFSVTRDTIAGLLSSGSYISSYIYDGYWNDVGTPGRLERASKEIKNLIVPV
jgi:NDP-sugar pyrophosphorylase family protein